MPVKKTSRRRVLVVDDDRGLNQILVEMLLQGGFDSEGVGDGLSALERISSEKFHLVLLDIGLPKMNGLDVLAKLRDMKSPPRVIVMTADDTPQTVLQAVKDQVYSYVSKPTPPKTIVEIAAEALAANRSALPIEIVSSKPDWIELLVPCQFEIADRIQSFLAPLESNFPEDVRESVGRAFRELLMNAIEWGGGLNPKRKVRIACIRTRRMLLYRIQDPGPGFQPDNLLHAAIANDADKPYAHTMVRAEKNIRPGGFGLLLTQALVDELVYNEAHNEVVFVKYLEQKE
jgi:CheY-like chemotaxis protein/anti-sigma regulatory factor (Ser/Thr protein kinase)